MFNISIIKMTFFSQVVYTFGNLALKLITNQMVDNILFLSNIDILLPFLTFFQNIKQKIKIYPLFKVQKNPQQPPPPAKKPR